MRTIKTCCECKIEKTLDQFNNHAGRKDGKQTFCRECNNARGDKYYKAANRRRQHLKDTYGITLEFYDRMLQDQGNSCAICKSSTPGGKYNRFFVDHCHDTDQVRGLLCYGCNIGLGHFNDDIEALEAAAKYLDMGSEA